MTAADEEELDYGDEFVVYLRNGNTIHTDTFADHEAGSSYVRVCDLDGKEIAYWSSTEWVEDPELVMGAILGAAGDGRDANEPGPNHHLHPARD